MKIRLKKLCNSFIVQRVAVAGIVFLSSLILAKTLGVDNFGQVAFYMYLIKFFLFSQFGSESGYLLEFYSSAGSLDSDTYLVFYSFQLWLFAALICMASPILGSVYFFASFAFALLAPLISVGPILRTKRMFGATLLPDLIVNFATLAGVGMCILVWGQEVGEFKEMLFASMLFIVIFFPIVFSLYRRIGVRLRFQVLRSKEHFNSYLKTVNAGIPLFMATLAYTLLLMVDRFFLERYHSPQWLSIYMLAFQLVTGASLVLSSQNFISVIDIGEKCQDMKSIRTVLRQQVIRSAMIGLISYAALLALALCLEKWYLAGYDGLIVLCATIGIGFILFFISGSVTPIVFYKGKQGALTKFIFIVVLLSIMHNILIIYMNWPTIWVAYFTAGWLGLYSIVATLLSWKIINKEVDL